MPDADDLRTALAHFDGNVKRVATYFARDRKQIYRWAEHHGIDLSAVRGAEGDEER